MSRKRFVYFYNSDWAVTRYGLQAAYDIAKRRLWEKRSGFYSWPLDAADKDWRLEEFFEAFPDRPPGP